MKLKDQMKLVGVKATDLADQLGLEYGQLSTCLGFDDRNEAPKRPSVKARLDRIREHLNVLVQTQDRVGADGEKRPGRLTVWDSLQEAARRFPAPPGSTVEHEFDAFTFGQRVRLSLDPDGSAVIVRFFRVVQREGREPYADVFDQETGAMRSIRIRELETGRRER